MRYSWTKHEQQIKNRAIQDGCNRRFFVVFAGRLCISGDFCFIRFRILFQDPIQADEVKKMDGVTSAQFISAGIHFYPRCGYRLLSEQSIAAHLNSDLETFNRMFADKDEFVKAMLVEYSNRALGRVAFDFAPNIEETERLYQMVWRLAVTIREHLVWIHRMLLDSAEGVDLITNALKKQHKMLACGMIQHIRACNGRDDVAELELFNQFEFLNGSIISPMIMNTRYRLMGILTDEMNERHDDLLTDTAIHQRMDWAFSALFPQYRSKKNSGQTGI